MAALTLMAMRSRCIRTGAHLVVPSQDDEGNPPALQILLIADSPICREEEINAASSAAFSKAPSVNLSQPLAFAVMTV